MKFNLAFLYLITFIISGCAVQEPAPIEYNADKSYTKNSSVNSLSSTRRDNHEQILENEEEEIINNRLSPEETAVTPTTGYLTAPNIDQLLAPEETIMPRTIDNRKLIFHQVQAGETLASIANDYSQTIEELEQLNNISSSDNLQEDQLIKIKVSNELLNKTNKENSLKDIVNSGEFKARSDRAQPIYNRRAMSNDVPNFSSIDYSKKNFAQTKGQEVILISSSKFIKPVEGKIITRFGDQTPAGESKGINIAANEGSIVKSIAAGKVAFAGKNKKFGNLLIIKLDQGDLYVAYAHLEDLIFKKDTLVAAGEIIGHVGHTGEVKSPQLHFAIREGKIAIDPLKYLKYSQ